MIEQQTANILIVDDEPDIGRILSSWLKRAGYDCVTATTGEQAVALLRDGDFQLVVSDIMMPGMSGIDLLTFIKESFPEVAVILVTAVDDRKTAIMTLQLGAYGYVIKPFDSNEILINVANALERRRLTLLSREYEQALETEVREKTHEIREREEEIVLRLISASGFRDDETGAHIKRIGLYASVIASDIGWNPESIADIRLAAAMHDVGKIGILDSILLKPGKLTPEEFEVMKTHTTIGARLLGNSKIPLLHLAKEIALSHHEKWDGSGYPKGLAGKAIPESGRIVALADVYDALVMDRVYRPAIPEPEALAMMTSNRGTYFDPGMFDRFMALLPEIRRIRLEVQDEIVRDQVCSG
jgi:putative two-component system response regulator